MDRSIRALLDGYASRQQQNNNQHPGGLENNGNDINEQYLRDFYNNMPEMSHMPVMSAPDMTAEHIRTLHTVLRGGDRPNIHSMPAMPAMPAMYTMPTMPVMPVMPAMPVDSVMPDLPYVAQDIMNLDQNDNQHALNASSNSNACNASSARHVSNAGNISVAGRARNMGNAGKMGNMSKMHSISGVSNSRVHKTSKVKQIEQVKQIEKIKKRLEHSPQASISSKGLIGAENVDIQPVHEAPQRELIGTENVVDQPVYKAHSQKLSGAENVATQPIYEYLRNDLIDTESVDNQPVLEAPPCLIPKSLSFMEPQGSNSCGHVSAPRFRQTAPMLPVPAAPESPRMSYSRARVAMVRGDVGRLGIYPVGPMYLEKDGINYIIDGNFIGQEHTLPTGHKIWVDETGAEVYPPNATVAGRPMGHPSGGFVGFGPV